MEQPIPHWHTFFFSYFGLSLRKSCSTLQIPAVLPCGQVPTTAREYLMHTPIQEGCGQKKPRMWAASNRQACPRPDAPATGSRVVQDGQGVQTELLANWVPCLQGQGQISNSWPSPRRRRLLPTVCRPRVAPVGPTCPPTSPYGGHTMRGLLDPPAWHL